MIHNNDTSITTKNHFLIFAVTLTALIIITIFTLSNALNMRNIQTGNLTKTQVIFNKPVPSGLGAAATGVGVTASGEASLPVSSTAGINAQSMKPLWIGSLFVIFSLIAFALFMMLRTLKNDMDMKAISQLHILARVEH